MKKVLNKHKGITLIALVITIIVLLILAGVTITTLTGENGLLSKASSAAKLNEKEKIYENIKLKVSETQANTNGNAKLVDIVQALKDDKEYEYIIDLEEETAKLSATEGDITTSTNIEEVLKDKEQINVIVKDFIFTLSNNLTITYQGTENEISNKKVDLNNATVLSLEDAIDNEVIITYDNLLTNEIMLQKIVNSSISKKFINYVISDTSHSMPILVNNKQLLKIFFSNDYAKALVWGNDNIEKNQTWINEMAKKENLANIYDEVTRLVPTDPTDVRKAGTATASSKYRDWNGAEQAFDENDDTRWIASGSSPCWITYEFPEAESIYRIKMKGRGDSESPKTFKIQGSNTNNSNDFTDLGDFTAPDYTSINEYILSSVSEKYKYIRLYVTSEFARSNTGIIFLQYYKGIDNNIKKSRKKYTNMNENSINEILNNIEFTLTDLSTIDGLPSQYLEANERQLTVKTATSSSNYRDWYGPGNASDEDETTLWIASGSSPCWITYEFSTAVSIYKLKMCGRDTQETPKTFVVQGSNTSSTSGFEDIEEFTAKNPTTMNTFYLKQISKKYRYIRFYITSEFSRSNTGIGYLQYYTLEK